MASPTVGHPGAAARELQHRLLGWYLQRKRSLPWRDCDDAYAVLVSEIMLQQTQVDRVVPAFESFLTRFPTARALATASVADVVTAWQGLGYNRRAVALHGAARVITERHGGEVPKELDELLALPGVGPYTARAIRAFAFGLDDAPVDTNIRRVLARAVTGCALSGRRLQEVADAVVPAGRGRDWSAALMDLGSAHCTARAPRCTPCPLHAACAWRVAGGDDPTAAPGRSRKVAAPFVGSNRYHRGRLLDALRAGSVGRHGLAPAAQTEDDHLAVAVAEGLVADGLAEWDTDVLRLPA